MNQEEAVKVFDLAVRQGGLPATMDKLVPLSFIGAAAVKFYQAKVKLMDQLGITEAQRKATLADGQDAGEMLLNIEAKIGELASQIPQVQAPGGKGAGRVPSGLPAKHDRLGLAQHRMKQSETIHRHPEAVARVIAEAKENEDIPTKTAVLQRIRLDHLEKSAGKQRNKPEKDISEVALILLRELGDVVAKLPALWKERAYLPEPLQESIIDAIEKLHSIMEAEA